MHYFSYFRMCKHQILDLGKNAEFVFQVRDSKLGSLRCVQGFAFKQVSLSDANACHLGLGNGMSCRVHLRCLLPIFISGLGDLNTQTIGGTLRKGLKWRREFNIKNDSVSFQNFIKGYFASRESSNLPSFSSSSFFSCSYF